MPRDSPLSGREKVNMETRGSKPSTPSVSVSTLRDSLTSGGNYANNNVQIYLW